MPDRCRRWALAEPVQWILRVPTDDGRAIEQVLVGARAMEPPRDSRYRRFAGPAYLCRRAIHDDGLYLPVREKKSSAYWMQRPFMQTQLRCAARVHHQASDASGRRTT